MFEISELLTVLEFDRRLREIGVDGENTIAYFSQNAEAKQKRVYEIQKLRDEIVAANINATYREDLLSSANLYLRRLNAGQRSLGLGFDSSSLSNSLLTFAAGVCVGAAGKYFFDKFLQNAEEVFSEKTASKLFEKILVGQHGAGVGGESYEQRGAGQRV